jgi:nitrate/TMAO reductase-like tetraheme cytochrome c subunit
VSEPETPEHAAAPPRRRRLRGWLLGLAGGLVVGGLALAGLWELSSSPLLCNACHIMKPYVEAWRRSEHSQVTCVRCHYPPGLRDTVWVKYQALTQVARWATQTYSSKPFAEVEDGSCLRSGCHDRQKLLSRTVSARGIVFDHTPHLEGTPRGHRLRCTSCHSQVVVTTHIEVTQASCFLCHFKGTRTARELAPIAGCLGCHEPPKGDIRIGTVRFSHEDIQRRGVACQKCHLNVVQGEGEAPGERCLGCHNQPEKLQKYGDVPLIHEAHATRHPIECGRCHTEIRHQLPPPIGAPATAGGPGPGALTAGARP